MDEDEERGLRAFALTVGCYAGGYYPERPQWVEREGVRTEIVAIDARWREEERLGFRVRLSDDTCILLYYVPDLDLWSGVPIAGPRRVERTSREVPASPDDE